MPDLQLFAENVWTVDGPSVRFLGVAFPTRMIIVKLRDGGLWVNSPVQVPGPILAEIKELSRVRYLIAPTKLHVWRLEEWHALFPDAELWAPPQLPRRFKRLPFRGVLGDAPPKGWSKDLDQMVFKGNLFIHEVFFFHRNSRTLIVADFIQNHPLEGGKPWFSALLKLDGIAYPHGGVPRDIRLSFTDSTLARQSLERVLAWDFDKLIIAHGVCVATHARRFVEQAFAWLED